MDIRGISKVTLIDYPGEIACTIFTMGCNFRCPYCHNPELVTKTKATPAKIKPSEILKFLKSRQNKLEGVVITGGEPTLQTDLPSFIKKIKSLGFKVKLDTNGTNFIMLNYLIKNNLLDYIAMDIKAPISKYRIVTDKVFNIKESIELIMNSPIPYEFRTTVVKELLSKSDLLELANEIKGAQKYVLQQFVSKTTLDPAFKKASSYSSDFLAKLAKDLKKIIKHVEIRE
ncbi:anaerobic ribonucleoside-triphosphate reductase activating protein [Candidatus Dojkabacteria bacterium]|nr:anaerobic ribonucleoside-triphosphate reductase activating protein [Candidatus Dojkabacteria bacterium]